MRILIVDDEPNIRLSLEGLLMDLDSKGYTDQVQQKLAGKLEECKTKFSTFLDHKVISKPIVRLSNVINYWHVIT